MKRREFLTPDLTPVIDIVFLLLVFFLVTTVFKKEELALLLNLPQTQAASEKVEIKEMTIEISPNKVALDGAVMTIGTLEMFLDKVTNKEQLISIRIDEEVPYKRVVKVLDMLKKNDLENIALITSKADEN